MQYRKWGRLPIATGNRQEQALIFMPRPHARSFLPFLALPLLLGLCACADTMTSEDSPPTSRQLQRDYDKTLTKAEQEAVISDLDFF